MHGVLEIDILSEILDEEVRILYNHIKSLSVFLEAFVKRLGGTCSYGIGCPTIVCFVDAVLLENVHYFINVTWSIEILPTIKDSWSSMHPGQCLELRVTLQNGENKCCFFENPDGLRQIFNKLKIALNIKNTHVVLIGSSKYLYDFRDIPQVEHNVADLFKLFVSKKGFGVPYQNVHVSLNQNSEEIHELLSEIANNRVLDGLIIYYAGHGVKEGGKKLFLTAANSRKTNKGGIISGLDYDFISNNLVGKSSAQNCIILLDACYSGLAIDTATFVDNRRKDIRILTSSASDELSYYLPENRNTFFTGALIDTLSGIDCHKKMISLTDLYNGIYTYLYTRNIPTPLQRISTSLPPHEYYISINPSYSFEKLKLSAINLYKQNKTYEALDVLNTLILNHGETEELNDLVAELATENIFKSLINEANILFYQQKDYKNAAELYSQALQLKADDTSVKNNLRICWEMQL